MRPLNRVLALVLAVALLVGGVLLAVEVAAAAVGHGPLVVQWHGAYEAGGRDARDSSVVRTLCGAVAVVGLLMLLGQLKRRRPDRLALEVADEHTDAGVSPAALRATVRSAALAVDGVSAATVRVTRRVTKVRATSRFGDRTAAEGLVAPVTARVEADLARLRLRTPLRPRITVHPRRGAES